MMSQLKNQNGQFENGVESTDEYSEADEEEGEGKPSPKRLHRIETDEEESCDNAHGDADQPAHDRQPRVLPSEQDNTKKPYRIDSDEEEDFENVGKVEPIGLQLSGPTFHPMDRVLAKPLKT